MINEMTLFLGIPTIYLKIIFGLILSFVITFTSIPTILKISKRKNLMEEPVDRSSHETRIPNLGGVAIFYSIGICTPIFAYELFESYKFLFASLVILLYIGVMDDIVVIGPRKKLIAQILISAFMVIGSDVRIKNLFGVLGVYELNYYISVFFSILTFIILINAFNLIDGIDGLAGSYSLVTSCIFGICYYRLGEYNFPMVVLTSVIVGTMTAFLYYNLSERKLKIFMGDTGSMILGFLLTFTAIYFINIFDPSNPKHYHLESAPAIAFAILILPIIDTLNVIIVRLANKKSPLRPDRNHLHHKLLNLGFSHKKSVAYIIVYYLLIIIFTYVFRHLKINILLFLILILGFLGAYLPNIYKSFKS